MNEYKQEALNYTQKKKDERRKRIEEERELLAQREQQEKAENEKIYREKLKRKNAQLEEYQSMLMRTKNNIPGYKHNSNNNRNEVVLNNWGGQEINHYAPKNQIIQPQTIIENAENQINSQNQIWQNSSLIGRRGGYRNEDHLSNFFDDNKNGQEYNKQVKEEKELKQKIYKDLLYSQFQEANNKNLNLYGTNDPLILERKRKNYLSENPYAKNNNYEFGKSTLAHNPITDPQNNMNYNKYLRFSESNSNINKINNSQLNNFQQEKNNYEQNVGYQNNNNRRFDDFKSNNYDISMNVKRGDMNSNYTPIILNSNYLNNNIDNRIGQNQSNGYNNDNSFRPTPSGQRIRQAASTNFF